MVVPKKQPPHLCECLDCTDGGHCNICLQATCCPCWLYAKNWVYRDDPQLLDDRLRPGCAQHEGECYCDRMPCNRAFPPCLLYLTTTVVEGYFGVPYLGSIVTSPLGYFGIPYFFQSVLVCLQQREVFKNQDTTCRCGGHAQDQEGCDCSCLESFLCGPCKLAQEAIYYENIELSGSNTTPNNRPHEAPYMKMRMPM